MQKKAWFMGINNFPNALRKSGETDKSWEHESKDSFLENRTVPKSQQILGEHLWHKE